MILVNVYVYCTENPGQWSAFDGAEGIGFQDVSSSQVGTYRGCDRTADGPGW